MTRGFIGSRFAFLLSMALVLFMAGAVAMAIEEWKSGKVWPEPKILTPVDNGAAPPDAIVLFDGKDMSAWDNADKWKVKDGVVTCGGNDIHSKQAFGDCQLHIEFATPEVVRGSGQGRGNSGIFLMDHYELQVLDSYKNETYFDGQCGAIYKQHPPLVNACKKPGEWQTYDVVFTAPRFDESGKVKTPAYITVLQNGICVQDHFEILGSTAYDRPPVYEAHKPKEPLRLQYHNNPVRFRNIWVRELVPVDFTMPDKPAKTNAPAKG